MHRPLAELCLHGAAAAATAAKAHRQTQQHNTHNTVRSECSKHGWATAAAFDRGTWYPTFVSSSMLPLATAAIGSCWAMDTPGSPSTEVSSCIAVLPRLSDSQLLGLTRDAVHRGTHRPRLVLNRLRVARLLVQRSLLRCTDFTTQTGTSGPRVSATEALSPIYGSFMMLQQKCI